MPKLASISMCTGCLSCHDRCPHHSIKITFKNGFQYPEINKNECTDCHLCEKACPIITPQQKNQVENMRAYGGWAKDTNTRINGASGGAFAGLAQSYIKAHIGNVSVYGAALINNTVQHKRITTVEEIPLLMNSKYIQSSTAGIYQKVRLDLSDGLWVLFSGTPCQVAALYAFLGKERDSHKLLTIEVVCHGVASKEALDIHLEHFHSRQIYSFRNKLNGQYYFFSECTTIEKNGKPYCLNRNKDVFYKIYTGWLLDRKACNNCQFSTLNRMADISLADFWGGVQNTSEYEKGVNVIVANNIRAISFLHEAKEIETYGSTIGKAIEGNPHFYTGFKYIQYHPLVLWPEMCRKVLPQKIWIQVVTNQMPWKLIWGIYKVLTIVNIKRQYKKVRKKYAHLLDEWVSEEEKY